MKRFNARKVLNLYSSKMEKMGSHEHSQFFYNTRSHKKVFSQFKRAQSQQTQLMSAQNQTEVSHAVTHSNEVNKKLNGQVGMVFEIQTADQ